MIQANDLRLGNWVALCFGNKEGWFNARVTSIHHDNTIDTDTQYGDGGKYYYEPIPLTPEILVKCGFKCGFKKYDNQEYQKAGLTFFIYCWPTGLITADNGRELCDLKYLHQLQNLIFAFTGKEVTINNL